MRSAANVCIIALGCPKNIVESEHLAGLLQGGGLRLTTDIASADYALVHTCSFIADARRESEEVIAGLLERKRSGTLRKVVVTGCLVQSEQARLMERFPDIDGCIGTGQLERVRELFGDNAPRSLIGVPGGLLESPAPRLLSSLLPSAYLRLSEGCNHRCSFCVIPRLRGSYRSRAVESLVTEARALSRRGIEEIILIAQDITCYGKDRYGRYALPELLKRLTRIDGVRWLRLMYAYPNTITGELLDVMANEPKVCNYIDVPLQHISDRVLASMRRPRGAADAVRRLKERVPGIALRTSFITGFPGETEKDFREMARFVEQGWFEQVGVFEYSPSDDTAARFAGQVPGKRKRERRRQLMKIQQNVVAAHHRRRIGSTFMVLTEGRMQRGWCCGRTEFQAPDVDSKLLFKGTARPGDFVTVKVTGARGYDLIGEQVPSAASDTNTR